MARCNVIVIGASAGGVDSLIRLVSALPAILSRHGPLPVVHATDGEPLQHRRIYVARPDRHLLVKRRTVRVVNGPNENGHRPAVDPLVRTAARAHGARTIGMILSGSLDDGTAGLYAIKQHGGTALVQDRTMQCSMACRRADRAREQGQEKLRKRFVSRAAVDVELRADAIRDVCPMCCRWRPSVPRSWNSSR